MEHHVGIDVSLELSSLCVLDVTGKVVREAKVASEPEALVAFLRGLGVTIVRVGLEAGPLSQWLDDGLQAAGFEAVLLETRHVKAALSAIACDCDSASRVNSGSSTTVPRPLFCRYCEIIEAATCESRCAPETAMSTYIAGSSVEVLSPAQPASAKSPKMAMIARVMESPKLAPVVAYQPWLKGERGRFSGLQNRLVFVMAGLCPGHPRLFIRD